MGKKDKNPIFPYMWSKASLPIQYISYGGVTAVGTPGSPWGGRSPRPPWGTSRPSRDGAELEAPTSLLWLLMSIGARLSSILQLAVATLPLFELLNLCFSSLFHTHTDSLPSPKALRHLPGSEIKCEDKFNSTPHDIRCLPTPPPPSLPPRVPGGTWAE